MLGWRLVLEDGNMITERMVRNWNNLGDIKIREIVFRVLGKRLSFSGAKKYCIAIVGYKPIAAQQRHTGYCIYAIYDNKVIETTLLFDRRRQKEYPIEQLQIAEKYLRNGIQVLIKEKCLSQVKEDSL